MLWLDQLRNGVLGRGKSRQAVDQMEIGDVSFQMCNQEDLLL